MASTSSGHAPWVDEFEERVSDYQGYVTSQEHLRNLISNFELNTQGRFAIQRTKRCYGKEPDPLNLGSIHWQDTKEGIEPNLTCDCIPFVIMGSRTMECLQGTDRERRIKRKKELPEEHNYDSNLKDCNVKINIRHIVKFPDYECNAGSIQNKKERDRLANTLLIALRTGKDVLIQHQYHVKLPESHGRHKPKMVPTPRKRRSKKAAGTGTVRKAKRTSPKDKGQHSREMNDKMEAAMEFQILINEAPPMICLVCDNEVKNTPTSGIVEDLFLEGSVTTHSQQQLSWMLSDILKYPIERSQVYSRSLCQRCFQLLDNLDAIQQETISIRNSIARMYNHSSLKRFQVTQAWGSNLNPMQGQPTYDQHQPHVIMQPTAYGQYTHTEQMRVEEHEINADHWNKSQQIRSRGEGKGAGRGKGRGRSPKADGDCKQNPAKRAKLNVPNDCPYCPFKGESKQSLLTHKYAAHRHMECPHCGKLCTTWWSYEGHLAKYHSEGPRNQEQRPKIQSTVTKSGKKKTSRNMVPVCEKCNKVFYSRPSLNYHNATVHAKPVPESDGTEATEKPEVKKRGRKRTLECETCHKGFKSRPSLNLHEATEHSKSNKIYPCYKCDAEFNNAMLLKSHLLCHLEKTVTCQKCDKKFSDQKLLANHENLCHRKLRSYTCKTCKKIFRYQHELKQHQKTHHESQTCKTCGVHFVEKRDYVNHIGRNGLRCIICKKVYKSVVEGHKHYRAAHPKVNRMAFGLTCGSSNEDAQDAAASKETKEASKSTNRTPKLIDENPDSPEETQESNDETPMSSEKTPKSSDMTPKSTSQKPSLTCEKPSSTNDKPSSTNDKPSSTSEKEISTREKPSSTNETSGSTSVQCIQTLSVEKTDGQLETTQSQIAVDMEEKGLDITDVVKSF